MQGPDGEILGSGFLVDERRVLTCAHVVEGLDEVGVVFPAEPAAGARAARVTSRAYDGKGQDLAVLELVDEPPEAARPLRLEAASAGGRFRALGFPAGHDHGLWVRGTAAGSNLLGWVQIEPDGARDVAKGFSGGAAWSDERQAAVGMVVARSGERVAWMVPAARLHETFPEVAVASALQPTAETRPFRSMAVPPELYVPRIEYGPALAALTASGGTTVALTTALRGAGGFGKTTLAQALATDATIRNAYAAGVLWMTMGENLRPADRLARVRDLLRWWSSEEPPAFETATAAGAALRDALAGHRVLVVVDDVWDPADLAPFHGLGGEACLLVTTRDNRNLSTRTRRLDVDAMELDEAVALLAAGLPPPAADDHRERLRLLARRLGEWPLLLALVNRQLVELVTIEGLSFARAFDDVEQAFNATGLTAFDRDDSSARQDAVSRTLAVSLDRLSDAERAWFFELAVFPEDTDVPLAVAAQLWSLPITETKRLCVRLRDLSLLRDLNRAVGTLRLHDVIRRYLLDHLTVSEEQLHSRLIERLRPLSGRWADLPDESLYTWHNLTYHLARAGAQQELERLIFDFDWMQGKLQRLGVTAILADCAPLVGDPEVAELHGALRLAAHIVAQDPQLLAGQLLGRLRATGDRKNLLLANCRRSGGLLHLHPGLIGPHGPIVRILQAHAEGIEAIARLDDRRLISGCGEGTLRVWDVETGEIVRTLDGHVRGVRALAVLPDARVVSAAIDDTLRLWDVETGETIRTFPRHHRRVRAVAVVGENKLFCLSDNGIARVWDIDTGHFLDGVTLHGASAVAVLDARRIIIASPYGCIRIWDSETGETRDIINGTPMNVRALAVLSGSRLAFGLSSGNLAIWDFEKRQTTCILTGHTAVVRAVGVVDDRRILSASDDHTLRLWDTETGKTIRIFRGHTDSVRAVTLVKGSLAASAGYDRNIILWNIENTEILAAQHDESCRVNAVAVVGETKAISASESGLLTVWDISSGQQLRVLEGHEGRVNAIAAIDEKKIISGSRDGTWRVWDIENGLLDTFCESSGSIEAVTAMDRRHVLVATKDWALRLWDLESGTNLRNIKGVAGGVRALAAVDKRRIISASYQRTLALWDIEEERSLGTIGRHAGLVQGIAVLDERRAVSASNDGTLRVWDLLNGEIIKVLWGHSDWVQAVAVVDQLHVVSASDDNTLRLWNVETGEGVGLVRLDAPVLCVATHPSTRTVVAGDASGRVHFLRYYQPSVAAEPAASAG